MDKNRFDSDQPLWRVDVPVTVGNQAEEKTVRPYQRHVDTPREEKHRYEYQYLYIEDEERKDK